MPLFVTSLNSGSNANCYYVGNGTEAILVDAGLSCRETERRMKRLGLDVGRVKAVFISHEHTDHIKGLPVLVRKHHLPVYMSPGTYRRTGNDLTGIAVRPFVAHEPVAVGGLSVTAFPKPHDAADPHSFVVSNGEVTVGVFTDIGAPCEHLERYFAKCQAAFLEANFDDDMLERGSYPYYLKRRIRGGHGHLSNARALAFFNTHRPAGLSHLFLSHLSKNNNCPVLVKDLFESHANGTEIVIASRHEETAVYCIGQGTGSMGHGA
ncbi:MAG: MBL fold metallo-hydrolase [Cytophagales bacterium]|nr:MBL fold metallo-hydrolase [Cytophagales bacterium]